jgi:hypothetical protein
MEWFRSSSTYAKRGTVDREKGAIFGVSVNTVGEAKGHGVHLEQSFVERVAELGNAEKNGLKARFGHPSMCSTALGTFLGRFKNFRVEGEQVLADLFLSGSAKDAPGGNLYDYVLGLAESESDMFGTSIVFTVGEEYQLEGDDRTFVTCDKLHACDVVDDPAANPDGLFSAFNQDALSSQVSEFLGTHPEIYEILSTKPEIVKQFMKNYEQFNNRKGESEMTEDVKEVEELETAETVEVEQLETDVVEEVAESTEDTAEEVEELEAVEEVAEVVEVKEELSSVDLVKAFQALADEHGYEFAKANHGKSEVEVLKAVIAQKDEELSNRIDGVDAVEFSDGEAKPKLSLKEAIANKLKK